MFNILKKRDDILPVENTNSPFSHGPQLKREKRLSLYLWFSHGVNLFLIFCFFIATVFFLTTDPKVIVVDAETGEVIGEYRTTAYKTQAEIKGGMQKFLEYYLSFNSKTVYEDHARAINMMSDELSRERIDYLKKTNLTYEIFSANTTFELDFKKTIIKQIKDGSALVELAGDLIIYTHGARPTTRPFNFVLKAQMVTLKGKDTIGLKITEIFEYD